MYLFIFIIYILLFRFKQKKVANNAFAGNKVLIIAVKCLQMHFFYT